MKAIMYSRFGTADVLEMSEQPKPTVKAGEVLVRVKAFSINPMDWKIRRGAMTLMSGSKFPRHTAVEFAGIIEDMGSSVTGLSKGDEVFGVVKNMMKEGVSAEYIAVTAALVWKKPSGISFPQAASLPVAGTAALTVLEKIGHFGPQTEILVNGATGGVGMFLLQLLKQKGANVTAVAGTGGMAAATNWGAGSVINYTTQDVLSRKAAFDVVIDLSGKMGYNNARQIMKPKALFLNLTPKPVDIPVSVFKNLFRSRKHVVILSAPSAKYTDALLRAVQNGLQVQVSKVFSFAQYKSAYSYAEQGGYTGKLAIAIN